jgi:hypothetical protein
MRVLVLVKSLVGRLPQETHRMGLYFGRVKSKGHYAHATPDLTFTAQMWLMNYVDMQTRFNSDSRSQYLQ